jgi:hypothetical protein
VAREMTERIRKLGPSPIKQNAKRIGHSAEQNRTKTHGA